MVCVNSTRLGQHMPTTCPPGSSIYCNIWRVTNNSITYKNIRDVEFLLRKWNNVSQASMCLQTNWTNFRPIHSAWAIYTACYGFGDFFHSYCVFEQYTCIITIILLLIFRVSPLKTTIWLWGTLWGRGASILTTSCSLTSVLWRRNWVWTSLNMHMDSLLW